MAKRSRRTSKYPRVATPLPAHLYARLQAASSVLGTSIHQLIEEALDAHLAVLDDTKQELIDRVASETLVRTDNE